MKAPGSVTGRWRGRLGLRLLVVALVAALIVLLVWATLVSGRGRSLVARVADGHAPAAPLFELEVIWPRSDTWPQALQPVLTDGRLALEELHGRPVVVNFWASWCLPCREEAPLLNRAAQDAGGEVVFVGIDVQDVRVDALAFLREFAVPYISVRDEGNDTYRSYGLTGVPETYYIDAQGRIVAHTAGAISETTLAQGIERARAGSPDDR